MSRYFSPYPRFIPLLGLVLSLYGFPAGATTFTVTNLNDSGPGSLRQAILDANATADDDTIVFQSGLSGAIALTSGELEISSNLTINGLGANVLAVSGNKISRIFKINSFTTATINGLTLKDGNDSVSGGIAGGGGIKNSGSLTVTNSTLSGNSTIGSGGGIINGGILIVSNSTLSGNWTIYKGGGGGIYNGGILIVSNSTLSGNSASANGGGIANYGTVTVTDSTLSGNSAFFIGGGILNLGTLTVNNSTLSSNKNLSDIGIGGGIANYADTLTLGNSIVAGNIALTGKELYNSTTPGSGFPPSVFISLGHNLFGENGVSGVEGTSLAQTDIVPTVGISAILAPLGNYGGPTQTHLLVPGSPAINAGDNALIPASVTTDQRGFPRIQAGMVDIGAVEVGEAGATDIPTLSQWAALGLVALLLGLSGWWLRQRKLF